jgi:hypothetical protein
MAAFLSLAHRRKRRENAVRLATYTQGARGDVKDIKAELKKSAEE